MQITLHSGTNAVIEKSVSNRRELGLVVIPDVMGLRPLFYDMVKRLARVRAFKCRRKTWSGFQTGRYPSDR